MKQLQNFILILGVSRAGLEGFSGKDINFPEKNRFLRKNLEIQKS